MSTDLHGRTPPPSRDERPGQPEKPKSALSITQVVGGALAAMTAAALGSRLSLAGTVVGAAIASVVAAVAGALYTASLRRTSRRVSSVLARVRSTGPEDASVPAGPGPVPPGTAGDGTRPDLLPQPVEPITAAPRARARVSWKTVVLGAVLMFLVAALVLTGIELATGRALSGGRGTTVGQVADPGTRPTTGPTRSASPTPSATPSTTPSTTPSASATATPGAGPSASATAEPSSSQSREPTAEPTPSASATPPGTPAPTPSGAFSAPAATPGS